jgi:hypothetical protein
MKKNAKYGSKKATPVANATKAAAATVNAPIKATVNVAKYPSRTFTQREQADKLTGYLEVGSNVWPQIRYGTHIRYYLKTGEFRTGGFVAKNPVEVVISEDNDIEGKFPNGKKMYIKIQNGFNDKLKGF